MQAGPPFEEFLLLRGKRCLILFDDCLDDAEGQYTGTCEPFSKPHCPTEQVLAWLTQLGMDLQRFSQALILREYAFSKLLHLDSGWVSLNRNPEVEREQRNIARTIILRKTKVIQRQSLGWEGLQSTFANYQQQDSYLWRETSNWQL